ncbi:MAG TPA: hypothetical protein VJ123_04475 [Anaerolineales bacterium]|nr:hypothetical protein [Anaerolineales bacterium]
MNARWRGSVGCLLAVAALLISTASVWAKELSALTISGPGIDGEITLDDPEAMRQLEKSGFLDLSLRVRQPAEELGTGYSITLYLILEDGPMPWMAREYYPGAVEHPGYMHLVGASEDLGFQPDEWYRVSPAAEAAFADLMAAHGVVIIASDAAEANAASAEGLDPQPVADGGQAQVLSAPSSTSAEAATATSPLLALGGASLALLAALGIAVWQRRRRASQPVTVGR